jgi:hypothetical protein
LRCGKQFPWFFALRRALLFKGRAIFRLGRRGQHGQAIAIFALRASRQLLFFAMRAALLCCSLRCEREPLLDGLRGAMSGRPYDGHSRARAVS